MDYGGSLFFMIVNLIFYFLGEKIRNFYYLLLAFLVLEESVVGPLTLLTMALTQPKQAGDASNLANMTVLPAFVWALLFLLFSLWCARDGAPAVLEEAVKQVNCKTGKRSQRYPIFGMTLAFFRTRWQLRMTSGMVSLRKEVKPWK